MDWFAIQFLLQFFFSLRLFLNIHLNPFGTRRQGRDCSLIRDVADARFFFFFLELEERQSNYQPRAGSAALCICFLMGSGFWCLECSFKKAPTPPALHCGICTHARMHASQPATKETRRVRHRHKQNALENQSVALAEGCVLNFAARIHSAQGPSHQTVNSPYP